MHEDIVQASSCAAQVGVKICQRVWAHLDDVPGWGATCRAERFLAWASGVAQLDLCIRLWCWLVAAAIILCGHVPWYLPVRRCPCDPWTRLRGETSGVHQFEAIGPDLMEQI